MTEAQVSVFFYGSYINFDVLAEANIEKREYEIARLMGYTLAISPLANIIPSKYGTVYGILTRLTHRELDRLYTEHARDKLGQEYLPQAVIIDRLNGVFQAALTYIAHEMKTQNADPAYVDRILKPAETYGFPAWYREHIAAFKAHESKFATNIES